MSTPTLIVFSHLRWNFVYQRPQHLMSRLAQRWPVLFIEEPVHAPGEASFDVTEPAPGVRVLRPHTPANAPGFHDGQLAHLQSILAAFLEREAIADYMVWFYTPMALPLLTGLHPRAVIYDCMDELSAFKDAPRQMAQREHALLKCADVVFTGGPSLYELKRIASANAHCFPSAVDAAHFATATTLPRDGYAGGERPALGYFGVIDERMDLALLNALASAHPEWDIQMVGPVVKIDPASLPKHPNLYWLGQQRYEDLPGLISGWDVCLLPFAINASTRYISPTKTLEYMAAARPVVSTAIRDVVTLYGDCVQVTDSIESFLEACEQVLGEAPGRRARRHVEMMSMVGRFSWDATASAVIDQIERLVPPPRIAQTSQGQDSDSGGTVPAIAAGRPVQAGHLIIGAGPTGLAVARELGAAAKLIEREAQVGGWCRSVR